MRFAGFEGGFGATLVCTGAVCGGGPCIHWVNGLFQPSQISAPIRTISTNKRIGEVSEQRRLSERAVACNQCLGFSFVRWLEKPSYAAEEANYAIEARFAQSRKRLHEFDSKFTRPKKQLSRSGKRLTQSRSRLTHPMGRFAYPTKSPTCPRRRLRRSRSQIARSRNELTRSRNRL